MAYKLIIEPDAQLEIDEAVAWYESKQKELGNEFLDYLEGYFKTLETGKSFFSIKKKPSYRELPLKRFRYVIIYEALEKSIVVYSVFNTHQDPPIKIP